MSAKRTKLSASASVGEQLPLRFRRRGGARPSAGRPRRSPSRVPHATRPKHSKHHPLHITLRLLPGISSLRGKAFKSIRKALALTNSTAKHRESFRLTHYSVQGNHIHLIAEADDRQRLARGVQGLAVRLARRLNLATGRRGQAFRERYHARALRTPLEVRRALAYVLLNERRHLAERGLSLPPWYFDPFSSAREFDGWRPIHGLAPPPEPVRDVTAPAHSFLLRVAWRKHGLILPHEVPGKRNRDLSEWRVARTSLAISSS